MIGTETAMMQLAAREPNLDGVSVLVVGLGKSGEAAARLALSRRARVTVADRRPLEDLGPRAEELRRLGAKIHGGGHPATLAAGAELVVVSPGVPAKTEILSAARLAGTPVWSEIELAARFCRGRVIGITGSNGKSTTTSMAGRILRTAGVPGGTGGNLDRPFSDLLQEDGPDAVHAVEISSFQLEWVDSFHPDVAVVLNFSPDHLDRHATLEEYAAAKARLLEIQLPGGVALLNADDAERARFEPAVRGRLHLFSTEREPERGAFVRDGWLVLRTESGEERVMDARELPVPGEHNLSNALAAALACRLTGCPVESIAEGLRRYAPLPHRLELVGEIDGVGFYNDSKATNPASAQRALESFAAGTVHLILGGRDKGADWSDLAEAIGQRARRLLLVGEAAPMLQERLAGTARLELCGTVERAVRAGLDGAERGEIVLLSPGCASFDQYRSFEDRGDAFRAAAAALQVEDGDEDA